MEKPPPKAASIEIADPLEIRVIDFNTGETRRYKSAVLDLDKERIGAAMPMDKRVPLAIAAGTEVVVALWKDYADHLFRSRVVGKVGGRVPQLLLTRPAQDDIKRTPRREYFRVDTKIATRAVITEQRETSLVAGVVVDLSAGGCRIQSYSKIDVQTELRLDFDLPFPPDGKGNDRTKPMRGVPGIVKLVNTPPPGARAASKRPLYFIGVEFNQLDVVMRNNILRYVASRQREVLNQLQRARDEDRPPASEVDDLEERLGALEQELKEAGQEVPEGVSPPPPVEAPGAAPALRETPSAPADGSAPAAAAPSTPAEAPSTPAGNRTDVTAGSRVVDEEEALASSADDLFAEPETPPTATPAAPAILPPMSAPSGKTVLLVEDDDALRSILAEALQHEGHAVIEASNGLAALSTLAATPVDLVMTDLMMPKMNGWRLMSAMRERGIEVPVVIITAYMNQEGQDVLTSRDVSSFLVKPVDLDEMAKVIDGVLRTPDATGPKQRILAVDDEEDVRLIVSTCLENAGYSVETAANGTEALAKVKQFKPQLVVMDIMMPGLNGFQVCEKLRAAAETADLPIVMLTVKAAAEYVRKAMSLRISGYLVKPMDPDALLARVRKVLPAPKP